MANSQRDDLFPFFRKSMCRLKGWQCWLIQPVRRISSFSLSLGVRYAQRKYVKINEYGIRMGHHRAICALKHLITGARALSISLLFSFSLRWTWMSLNYLSINSPLTVDSGLSYLRSVYDGTAVSSQRLKILPYKWITEQNSVNLLLLFAFIFHSFYLSIFIYSFFFPCLIFSLFFVLLFVITK